MGSDILLLVSDCDRDAVALSAAAEDLCGVVVATDAGQCIQFMSQSPSIVLVSDQLSDVAAVCADIRKDPAGAFTPILILTDQGAFPDADTDGVIRRPVEASVLAAWVQAAQCIARMRQDLTGAIAGKQDHEQLLNSFAKLSHAVNNPLQALYAVVDMLVLSQGLSDDATALTSEIITHAGRVANLVAEASEKAKLALKTTATERPSQVS
jgi:hypothetical protein